MTDGEYRYPTAAPQPPALTWSELAPGTRLALVDAVAHIEPSSGAAVIDEPVVLMRATVMGAPFAYINRTGSNQEYPTGTQVVNLALDDGTVKTITSRRWGFSPTGVKDGIDIHGTYYCTPLS